MNNLITALKRHWMLLVLSIFKSSFNFYWIRDIQRSQKEVPSGRTVYPITVKAIKITVPVLGWIYYTLIFFLGYIFVFVSEGVEGIRDLHTLPENLTEAERKQRSKISYNYGSAWARYTYKLRISKNLYNLSNFWLSIFLPYLLTNDLEESNNHNIVYPSDYKRVKHKRFLN